MNKKTTIAIAIFVALLLVFIVWNRFYSPNQWGRCQSSADCVPWKPAPGMNYFCEDNLCKSAPFDDSKKCSVDSDCIAATCCHASEAVNKENAPDCSGVFCTQECVSGTIDCQQGEIKCVNGGCKVIIYS
ncbi:hypothetical protein KY306_02400 [Candidatus Woesearchaeota archaeon]|nr:hypothetical protein [Candidatus Woesearchaeota archaeon]